jgi:dTDP-4-dehydrorhamnose reductase
LNILITGGGGLVATHLARSLAPEHNVVALTHSDLDITNATAVCRIVKDHRPSLVINCAVVGVDECERDPVLAQAINVNGPRNLAEACLEINAEILHFSSNYVFDGKRTDRREYSIEDIALPVNIYGQSKLDGERILCGISSRVYVIRTSWVFGAGKASFLSTAYENLRCGRPIRAISDRWACVTYADDLVERTKEILVLGHYGIYQIVNEGTCSYYHFAEECARLAGLSTAEAGKLIEVISETRLAPRPRWSPMLCLLSEKLSLSRIRDWRTALADYVWNNRRT